MPFPSRKGLILILSSPSGAGKTTLAKKISSTDENFKLSVSCTTRSPRSNEIEGVDYNFIKEDRFKKLLLENKFLESALVFGNYYGTLKAPIEEELTKGKDFIFDIDWQGTEQVKKILKKDIVTVFIMPPSLEELEDRLRNREEKNFEFIKKRMMMAKEEINHWKDYNYILVNNEIENSFRSINQIIKIEREKRYNIFN